VELFVDWLLTPLMLPRVEIFLARILDIAKVDTKVQDAILNSIILGSNCYLNLGT